VKVSSTELPPRQVSLDIEVEQERLDKAMDDAYRRVAGRVDVPGFRRGKAPRSMVERMIGRDRIREEALDRLVPEVVSEAMEQEKVEPFIRPRVESIEFDPLRLKAIVGLAPRVELGDYHVNLRVEQEQPQVGEEQVNEVIERLRQSNAQWVPVERGVQSGDRVGLDLRATLEGREEPVLESKEAEYVVDAEGAQPAPGFAEQLIGLTAGETRTFPLTMAEDNRDKDAAGKPAEFTVTLHWVKERELPPLDDELAQRVGDYADLAALRAAIDTQLRQREEERVREKVEEESLNKLVEISSVEFPPQLVDQQAQYMLETFTRNVERQGLQLAQYLRLIGKDKEAFDEEIRSDAETRVRRSLALNAFADAEHITASEEPTDDQLTSREALALARLVELATGDARDGAGASAGTQSAERVEGDTGEKTAEADETSDTGTDTSDVERPTAPVAEEDQATA
jgi:trigger factor